MLWAQGGFGMNSRDLKIMRLLLLFIFASTQGGLCKFHLRMQIPGLVIAGKISLSRKNAFGREASVIGSRAKAYEWAPILGAGFGLVMTLGLVLATRPCGSQLNISSNPNRTLESEGGILCGSCVRLSVSPVSPGVLTTCSTPLPSRAGHPIATRLGAG